jgi:hypothetical protein
MRFQAWEGFILHVKVNTTCMLEGASIERNMYFSSLGEYQIQMTCTFKHMLWVWYTFEELNQWILDEFQFLACSITFEYTFCTLFVYLTGTCNFCISCCECGVTRLVFSPEQLHGDPAEMLESTQIYFPEKIWGM